MANAQRGEIEVKIGNNSFICRPSFNAIAAIECRTQKDIIPLGRRYTDGRLNFGLQQTTIIIEECIKAAGGDPPEDLGEQICRAGLLALSTSLSHLMTYMLCGDEAGEKVKEAREKADAEARRNAEAAKDNSTGEAPAVA